MIRKVVEIVGQPINVTCEGTPATLLLVDAAGMAALSAAVDLAFEDPETVPGEYAVAGAELTEFFRSQP